MKTIEEKLSEIKEQAKKRCIIFASGPSVIDFDFSILKNTKIDILCVNGAIDILLKNNITPNYYCVVDTGFIANRRLFNSGVKSCKYFFTSKEVLIKAIKKFIFWNFNKNLLINSCVNALKYSVIERKFIDGGTVVSNAIQVLLMMDYNEIYISGMDLFGEKRAYHEKVTLPSYLEKDFYSKIEPFFKELRLFSEENGIHIYNLSPCSKLSGEIIKKIESIIDI